MREAQIGAWLIVGCVVLVWMGVLLFAAIYWHERRFLESTLTKMQAINDEWIAAQHQVWGERAEADARRG